MRVGNKEVFQAFCLVFFAAIVLMGVERAGGRYDTYGLLSWVAVTASIFLLAAYAFLRFGRIEQFANLRRARFLLVIAMALSFVAGLFAMVGPALYRA